MQMVTDQDFLTFDETREMLRVSRCTLFEMIHRGEIPCRRMGRIWRFHRPTVIEWFQGNPCGLRSRR
jgi:excisionase family DNA binding protein